MLLKAPSYLQIFPKLEEILKDKILVAHSKGADLNYIYCLEEHYGLPKLYSKWIDTKEIARFLNIEENIPCLYLKLFGTQFIDHHKALNDARACGQIIERLCSRIDIRHFIHVLHFAFYPKYSSNSSISFFLVKCSSKYFRDFKPHSSL